LRVNSAKLGTVSSVTQRSRDRSWVKFVKLKVNAL
jgi:hypothetical protein